MIVDDLYLETHWCRLTVLEKFLQVVRVPRQLENKRRSAEFLRDVLVQQFQVFVHVVDVGHLVNLSAIETRLLQLARHLSICVSINRKITLLVQ